MKKMFFVFSKNFNNQLAYEEWIKKNNLQVEVADYDIDDPEADVIFRPRISGSGVFEDEVIKNAPRWVFKDSNEYNVKRGE